MTTPSEVVHHYWGGSRWQPLTKERLQPMSTVYAVRFHWKGEDTPALPPTTLSLFRISRGLIMCFTPRRAGDRVRVQF